MLLRYHQHACTNLDQGKSVICSKVIEHIQDMNDTAVIFYFCQHQQSSRRQTNEILRSFTAQLLVANNDMALYILETFAYHGLGPSKKNLQLVFAKMIASLPSVRIVVDGLDEWPHIDQEEVIDDLLGIKAPKPGACKLLISSRKLTTISKFLQAKPTLRLDDNVDNVQASIAAFLHGQLTPLRERFRSDMIEELESRILSKANGRLEPQSPHRCMLTRPRDVPLGQFDRVHS